MEKYELEDRLKEEIRARVLGEGFMKLVQSVRRGGSVFRISLRPVEIGGERRFQAEMNDGGQVQVKNLDANGAAEGLEQIIAQKGARELHLMTASGDLHVRVTRKGHVLESRSAEMARVVTVMPHDRVKQVPLTEFNAAALLRVIGLTDGEGRVRASMRGKYDQVNEFLKAVKETVDASAAGESFTVVDCGCGKAYLTLALYCYLTEALKFKWVKVIGIDRRADVIEAARKMAAALDLADKVIFVEADLSSRELQPSTFGLAPAAAVDMIVSLHACDTATDEALARGVEWKARYILSAPCCQHELQKELAKAKADGDKVRAEGRSIFSGLLRQSILRERLCDLLTDSFRAMILRILGFKVQVVEFVSAEATARNLMLRCEYGVKPGQPGPIGEYLDLRDYWRVRPWLEERLAERLGRYLVRYSEPN